MRPAREPRRRRSAPVVPVEYAPGHFTAPVRAWFGADWQPQWPRLVDARSGSKNDSLDQQRRRENQAALGIGWGAGTMPLTRRPKIHRPPQWLARAG